MLPELKSVAREQVAAESVPQELTKEATESLPKLPQPSRPTVPVQPHVLEVAESGVELASHAKAQPELSDAEG